MFRKVVILLLVVAFGLMDAVPPSSSERSTLIQQQAQEDYKHHTDVLGGQNYGSTSQVNNNPDGSFAVTFDNHDKNYRDRGYGYEKAYAYSRETAFFDFVDDKAVLNAKDIVEKYGNSQEKDENLLDNISH